MDSVLQDFNITRPWWMEDITFRRTYTILSILTIVINVVFSLLSITQNLVLLMLLNKQAKTPSQLLLCNLAVTDLLTGLFTQPLYVAHITLDMLHKSSYPLLCCFGFSGYVCSGVSLLTVTGLSMDRLFATKKPFKYRVSRHRKQCMFYLAFIWLLIVLGSSLFFAKLSSTTFGRIAFTLVVSSTFLIFFYAYIHILRVTRKQRKVIDSISESRNHGVTIQSRMTKSFLILAAWLCIMYLPMTVIKLIHWGYTGSKYWHLGLANRVANTFMFMNSTVNPIIYNFRHKNLRRESMQLISRTGLFGKHLDHPIKVCIRDRSKTTVMNQKRNDRIIKVRALTM